MKKIFFALLVCCACVVFDAFGLFMLDFGGEAASWAFVVTAGVGGGAFAPSRGLLSCADVSNPLT